MAVNQIENKIICILKWYFYFLNIIFEMFEFANHVHARGI